MTTLACSQLTKPCYFVSIGSWTSQLPYIRFPPAAWEGFVEINSTMWRTRNSPENPGAGFTLAANFPSDPSLVTLPLRTSDSKLRCLGHLNDALS